MLNKRLVTICLTNLQKLFKIKCEEENCLVVNVEEVCGGRKGGKPPGDVGKIDDVR